MNPIDRLAMLKAIGGRIQRAKLLQAAPVPRLEAREPTKRIHAARRHFARGRYVEARLADAVRTRQPCGPARPPTKYQLAALGYIATYLADNGYPPFLSEVSFGCGAQSKHGAQCVVLGLAERGLLTWWQHVPRTYQLTEAGQHALETGEIDPRADWTSRGWEKRR